MHFIKKLNTFMLKTFFPLFCMTFFICVFILLMQFLFRHIDDLLGRGLGIDVLGELFFYASLTMVPMALPLAVLLASIMAFGSLGEHVELTALKSSGISLLRVMRPLIVFIFFISVGSFVFSNNVLPNVQVKMWTLMFSARQKSLSLGITEGTINSQIPGYNVYVKHKDKNSETLHDVIIYDISAASSYPRIVVADSGRLSLTDDRMHILLKLYHGNWYEDLSNESSSSDLGTEMYRRESFHDKEIIIPYDATFTRMDDNMMKSQYVGKNIPELQHSIDSIRAKVDSVGTSLGNELKLNPVCGITTNRVVMKDSVPTIEPVPQPKQQVSKINLDSILNSLSPSEKQIVVSQAINTASSAQQNAQFRFFSASEDSENMRRHEIELYRKFTLALACLIFFFIGAPLGAIIRKGGLGMPIVVSVAFFVVYYVIDNFGYKVARDGLWPVWEGIWLSSFVLSPLGAFLTYKSVNDSAVFNPDAYLNFFRKVTGLRQTRNIVMKEISIVDVNETVATERIDALKGQCNEFLQRYRRRQHYLTYFMQGFDKPALKSISASLEELIEYLSNSRDQRVINKAMDFPIIRQLLIYHITNYPKLGLVIAVLFPIGIPLYFIGTHYQKNLKIDLQKITKIADQVLSIFDGTDDRHQSN